MATGPTTSDERADRYAGVGPAEGSRQWRINIVAFVLVILVNWMANALPIGGQTTGEISDQYASLFTPAGFTFSIWGLIYLTLAGYVVYQAIPARRQNRALAGVDRLFVVNCALNMTWIWVWHYDQLALSLVAMGGILVTLTMIYRVIASARESGAVSWVVRLPFSLYTGWITVASIANISVVQTAMGWDALGLDVVGWTLLKLAVAGCAGAVMVLGKGDLVFGLVVAWAAFGISSKQADTLEVGGAASLLAIAMMLLVVYQVVVGVMRGSGDRMAAS